MKKTIKLPCIIILTIVICISFATCNIESSGTVVLHGNPEVGEKLYVTSSGDFRTDLNYVWFYHDNPDDPKYDPENPIYNDEYTWEEMPIWELMKISKLFGLESLNGKFNNEFIIKPEYTSLEGMFIKVRHRLKNGDVVWSNTIGPVVF